MPGLENLKNSLKSLGIPNERLFLKEFGTQEFLATAVGKQALAAPGLRGLNAPTTLLVGSTLGGPINVEEQPFRKLFERLPLAHSAVAQALKINGMSIPLGGACAAAAHCLITGSMLLLSGAPGAPQVVVSIGVDDQLSRQSYIEREDLGVISPDGKCIPYAAESTGISLGQSASALVLMTFDRAKKMNLPILAYLAGAAAVTGDSEKGLRGLESDYIEQAMRNAIFNAGLSESADKVGVVLAHGPGTKLGDEQELSAIRSVLPSQVEKGMPVVSTNAALGHLLGNSAGTRVALLTRIFKSGRLFPNKRLAKLRSGLEAYDKNLIREAKEIDIDSAMVNSFGFGHQYTSLLLVKYRGE